MINTYIPYFKKKDQNILNLCLKTNFVSTAGPLVKKFGEMKLTLIGSGFILLACFLLITTPQENAIVNI